MRKGFTVVELLISMIILGSIAAMVIPAYQAVKNKSIDVENNHSQYEYKTPIVEKQKDVDETIGNYVQQNEELKSEIKFLQTKLNIEYKTNIELENRIEELEQELIKVKDKSNRYF